MIASGAMSLICALVGRYSSAMRFGSVSSSALSCRHGVLPRFCCSLQRREPNAASKPIVLWAVGFLFFSVSVSVGATDKLLLDPKLLAAVSFAEQRHEEMERQGAVLRRAAASVHLRRLEVITPYPANDASANTGMAAPVASGLVAAKRPASRLPGRVKPLPQASAALMTCFQAAGARYSVDPMLLKAIAIVESSLRPEAENKDHAERTSSTDLGLMQINSRWLPTLSKYGITRETLLGEPCINAAVGAWILSDLIARMGATWNAVGAYNAACTQLKGAACDAARATYVKKVWHAYQSLQPNLMTPRVVTISSQPTASSVPQVSAVPAATVATRRLRSSVESSAADSRGAVVDLLN